MAKRSGGAVIIRKTQGRKGGTNARLGKRAGLSAIGGPTSSKQKAPNKNTVVSLNER